MARRSTVDELAAELFNGIGLIVRRMKQLKTPGDLSMAERATLSRLERGDPVTSADLARADQITPQAMGNILAGLEGKGLVERSADPHDGRRIIVALTEAGHQQQLHKRDARARQIADALTAGFSPAELDVLRAAAPLLERLADHL
jgi:DNA-binding MarR family transcriptional regulator